jgi:hypothetical protein
MSNELKDELHDDTNTDDTQPEVSTTETEAEALTQDVATIPAMAPAAVVMPVPETKMPTTILKSATRNIRKTVFATFRTMTESQIKAMKLEEFKTLILSIDPNWPIVLKGDKVVKTHLSWYRGAFKKLPADQRVTQPEPIPVVTAPAPTEPVVSQLSV